MTILTISLLSVMIIGCSNKEKIYYGVLEAEKVTIYSQVEGEIQSIEKDEQEEIIQNDVLGKIDDEYYELKRKEVEATVAMVEAKRKKAEDNNVSDSEMDMILAEIDQAKAIYDQAEYQKSKTIISAIQDGVISEWLVKEGDYVKTGTPLVTMFSNKPLEFTIYVPQTDLKDFQIDQILNIKSITYPDETFKGKVIQIGDEAVFSPQNNETLEEQAEKVFPIDIQVTENKDNKLKPGMDVTVSF